MTNLSLLLSFGAIALVVLVPCLALYLGFKNNASGEGEYHGWNISLGGSIAAYMLIFVVSVYQLLPSLQPNSHDPGMNGNWRITFFKNGSDTFLLNGNVSMRNQNGIVVVSGDLTNEKNSLQFLSKFGKYIEEEKRIVLMFQIFGGEGKTRGIISIPVLGEKSNSLEGYYSILQGSKERLPNIGRVVFERTDLHLHWLIVLCALVIAPLAIAIILWIFIPANQSEINGSLLNINFKLSGPIAAYIILFLIFNSAYIFMSENLKYKPPQLITSTTYNICGSWTYYNRFYNGADEGGGTVKIVQKETELQFNGKLIENGYKPVPWRSDFGYVSSDGEVIFYFEVQDGDGSKGIEYGVLLDNNPESFTLEWRDLNETWSSNRGITTFNRINDC